ncbi:nuclear transport factor 2 family protein [Ekhidna sp.]
MKSRITLLVLFIVGTALQSYAQSNQKYFRQISYNHVSPHVEIRGIYEIEKEESVDESHYIFSYDDERRLVEIVNNHYATERRHPLTTLGAYKTVVEYSSNKQTWTYFDKNGNAIENDRQVFKEEFLIDKRGFRYELNFYDAADQPMESMWKISKYTWKKHKNLVIEKRFNVNGDEVNVSPYFPFGTSGIEYTKKGYPKAHHNLDDELNIVNNVHGLASYKDEYDEFGNHKKWSYYDASDKLIKNQWGYAYAIKEYDNKGNLLNWNTYDENDELMQERKMVTNVKVQIPKPATKDDSLEIETVSKGYLESLQNLDSVQMKRVMHQQLAKRTIAYDRRMQTENIRETSYDQMVEFSKSWNKSGNRFPFNPSNKAIILDVYDRIATVKLVSDNWIEYLHLTKIEGEWKITNLLWQHKNINAYSNFGK